MERTVAARRIQQLAGQMRAQIVDDRAGQIAGRVYEIGLGPVGLDTIWEAAGAGTDTVRSTANATLGANLENLVLRGTANLNGTGNALGNRMTGNTGNNWMNGAAGADTMFGGAGNDTLDGGAGNDLLRGDAGQDRFVFRAGADRVLDFANDVDTIALDDALWGGAPRTAAQLVAAATQVGSSVVFDFGAGNTLTIDNLLNKALLLDDLIIV